LACSFGLILLEVPATVLVVELGVPTAQLTASWTEVEAD